MEELAVSRPQDISLFTVGRTFEGREIRGMRINVGNVTGKQSIFFESAIHSNEWSAVSTTTFIINELLTSNDFNVREILRRFDWWFVPVVNLGKIE